MITANEALAILTKTIKQYKEEYKEAGAVEYFYAPFELEYNIRYIIDPNRHLGFDRRNELKKALIECQKQGWVTSKLEEEEGVRGYKRLTTYRYQVRCFAITEKGKDRMRELAKRNKIATA